MIASRLSRDNRQDFFRDALYTIYKALSAVKLCEDLRKQNIKAVPIFWIAEEDHDFDEVKKTFVLDKEGKMAEVENTPENYQEDIAGRSGYFR